VLTRQALSSLTGELPRPFWVMWWGTLLNRLCGFVTPFLTAQRGLTPIQAALVVSAMGLGNFFSKSLAGCLPTAGGGARLCSSRSPSAHPSCSRWASRRAAL